MDLGTSWSVLQINTNLLSKFSVRILNPFVKPSECCSMEQHGARLSEFAG